MGELGELLRSAREARGISLEQAEEATRIRKAYLEALEAEDFARMPAQVYVRGFLRNYALYLGLDPEEVLALRGALPEEPEGLSFGEQLEEPLVVPSARSLVARILAAVLIIGALGAAGWWGYLWYQGSGLFAVPSPTPTATLTATPVVVAPAVTPTTPAPPPTPTATPSPTPLPPTATPSPTATQFAGVQVSVEVIENTWMEVTVDGEEVLKRLLAPGESLSWTGTESIFVHCGNAGGIRVTVNGETIGTLGNHGEVVDYEWSAP